VAKSNEQVREEFQDAVNMDTDELKEWLGTDESREASDP
jgi:hypothetical protein